VVIEPHGPGPELTTALASRVAGLALVRDVLKRAKHRVLAVDLVEIIPERKPAYVPAPTRYRATLYDYTNQRTLYVAGPVREPDRVTITEAAVQPVSSPEEFRAAAKLLLDDAELGPIVLAERVQVYRPLPPVVRRGLPDGRSERVITVGLLPLCDGARHEIVGVDLARRTVVRFERDAPATAAAHGRYCGLPNAAQPTVRNAAGAVRVRVRDGRQTVWRLHVVRPAGSSGTNGSGVELRYVEYRGRRVLYRAHVPVLSVKYDHDACGPFRGWQCEEGMLHATGTDVAPGFRLCSERAQPIVDSGSDDGSFAGVAIYVDGLELVIVSELEVGWYRYTSEWRLHMDGTIRPRFGVSAVTSSCVCTRHFHHIYWRFDFDIRTAGGNRVREYNEPSLFGGQNWHTHHYEIQRPRDPARRRKWLVENVRTDEGYEIIPGPNDGVAMALPDWPFGQGDVWVLRYRASEIDDGVIAVGPPHAAPMNAWLDGEATYDQDVVIWYGAHVACDGSTQRPGSPGLSVGPTLKPVNW
jgi:hypothetical protein